MRTAFFALAGILRFMLTGFYNIHPNAIRLPNASLEATRKARQRLTRSLSKTLLAAVATELLRPVLDILDSMPKGEFGFG